MMIIADGGIRLRTPGDVTKALYAADTVMIGSALAGTDESPGEINIDCDGKQTKRIIGMASDEARDTLARALGTKAKDHVAQGVVADVPYVGPAEKVIFKFEDGTKHGIGNAGGVDIPSFKRTATIISRTSEAASEGRPHVYSDM